MYKKARRAWSGNEYYCTFKKIVRDSLSEKVAIEERDGGN